MGDGGLCDPRLARASCGVGFVCRLGAGPSHEIVRQGLRLLANLAHRGAVACDADTGDGAGILLQMPDRFLRRVGAAAGFDVPPAGRYAVGLIFLPVDPAARADARARMEALVADEGQQVLGWRAVPVRADVLGPLARHAQPHMAQLFIGQGPSVTDQDHFERILYLIRRRAEQTIRPGAAGSDLFHVASLSSRTLVYKGMLLARQLEAFYDDLCHPDMASAMALAHQRYSTNTFPSWDLAHPFRFLAHNGEINTLRGNLNGLKAREALLAEPRFGADLAGLLPLVRPGSSDSAALDSLVELLYHAGRPLPHCLMMVIPEAWEHHGTMDDARRAFYEYHACTMEPWDGPALVVFSDGRCIGAVLDRNGLRPARYTISQDGLVVLASETGVLDIPPDQVRCKGQLDPGRMFLADLEAGRLVPDEEIKAAAAAAHPYRRWLQENLLSLDHLVPAPPATATEPLHAGASLTRLHHLFGYTLEDLKILLAPMAETGKEPVGSMGDDIPPAILSRRNRLLYDYFRQLFAQVTNPPLDAIREALVTSLHTYLGAEGNLLDTTPAHCRRLRLDNPVLSDSQLALLRTLDRPGLRSVVLPILFPVAFAEQGLAQGLTQLCQAAADAVADGAGVLILSDRDADAARAPIPALLAVAGVHHHLIREGLRNRCALVVESAEPREVHHFCCLLGYGAAAVNPYLVHATLAAGVAGGSFAAPDAAAALGNYHRAVNAGILKVMSKNGISTLQSYQGAQIFECLGLAQAVVARHFTDTANRIGGADLPILAREVLARHRIAHPDPPADTLPVLPSGGKYKWRRDGEAHQYTPRMLAQFRQAVFNDDAAAWQDYSTTVDAQNRAEGLLRGLIALRPTAAPVPLEAVEPWTEIVQRFKTGGISYGAISKEAHEALAIAMNRIGARSNSGEGGEDADRYSPDPNGDWRNSAIKQVASGRFGVTAAYLANCREIQIKMAQGAKPGEGGQLPGFKVYPWIAKTRHSTPHVGLISPPPHHDIYSIEDLAQLIYDLKRANSVARISVKLVSSVGVGTIAAGVVKGGADCVLISGDTGGTGASPQGSIRHAGAPWELGLPEAHQTLVRNGLRQRMVLECDGQLKTGHDIAVACLLGAEEFGFGTLALVALGCVMMRVCHLNTCPVGVATQDPELRKKFTGRPEHVVAMMRFLAEELRAIMARLGFRRVAQMVGRADCLDFRPAVDHWKARDVDLSDLVRRIQAPTQVQEHCGHIRTRPVDETLEVRIRDRSTPALEHSRPVTVDLALRNVHRAVGTRLSSEIALRHGDAGLPDDTITLRCTGTAGQSFFAFAVQGLTAVIHGEANDYFGKGLCGAKLIILPPPEAPFAAEQNTIIGNVALYGATGGQAYIRGRAGIRFAVRNSGANAVVEGTGDHACEYMTGGRVVILGPTGRNTAAGMSGGIAYVLDETGDFADHRCNKEMVELENVTAEADIEELKTLVHNHWRYTQSPVARRIIDGWEEMLPLFVKIMPIDYKRVLEKC
ncbi:glutamate synthase large subunit [Desulfatitalea alkaliphila]|uniref:Glutamate synthase [NADPH] large chain n=1 Tax=Desulfatitalea alkaliphila TaxID=2929485 RepID=A0AA41UIF8_9BACT|nr:glutamate synthase large subunit [Desulfatitalea alkaliphila]MCJ8499542.1 glutamate synthase large subunit [Desulfatitalea alkaliphila]